MQKFKLSLLAVSLLALTACGSSGGGGGSDDKAAKPAEQVKPAEKTQPQQPAQPAQPSKPAEQAKPAEQKPAEQPKPAEPAKAGQSASKPVNGYGYITKQAQELKQESDSLNYLTVDGQPIQLIPQGFYIGTYMSTPTLIVSGQLYSQLKYGISVTKVGNMPFVQGYVTPESNIPKEGKASYQGEYLQYEGDSVFTPANEQNVKLLSQFGVDFAAKTIEGTLKTIPETNLEDVSLSAKINGSSFEGVKDGFTTKGYFYGNNAQELGGIYYNNDKKIAGAYAAKKQ